MEDRAKIELVVNAGLQAIPYVGAPLATLYFGAKQEKRLERIEQTLSEIVADLKDYDLPGLDKHNENELLTLIDELTDKIENEHLDDKRKLYKLYFEKILITPTNGNYEERKLFLDVLGKLSPLQVELLVFIYEHPDVVDLDISKTGVDSCVIKGAISQLENLGLIESRLVSITIGGKNASTPKYINISEFGDKFRKFCLE